MFGKNKVLKVKMKKGRKPVRKLRMAFYAGGIAMAVSSVVEP